MTWTKARSGPSSKNNHKIKPVEAVPIVQDFRPLFACFQHLAKRQLFFHSLFFSLACLALITFGFFFSFLADSFVMGIFLAFCFFTCVLYFVLRLYFQEQKPRELLALRDEYMAQFKTDPQQLAEIATICARKLDNAEVAFYRLPKQIEFLRPHLEKLWRACHWKDVHLFKEFFFRFAIEQHIQLVITSPTDADRHAELAECYLMLSEHFSYPLLSIQTSNKIRQRLVEQSTYFALHAIEELHIVAEFSPNDPWVHTKLAETYQALGQNDKAIGHYELLLQMTPDSTESLDKLGRLYFKQGMQGKGLKIYQRLQKLAPEQAKSLLSSYGSS